MRFPNEERGGDFSDIDVVHHYPVLVSSYGDTQDTLPRLEFTQQMAEIPSRGLRRPVFFGPSLEFALDCVDRLWFAHTGEYKLFQRTLDGDTAIVATLDGPRPAEVDEADRDWVRAIFERRPNPPLVADHLRALPARKPIIVDIFVDGAGHVFVIPETTRVKVGKSIRRVSGRRRVPWTARRSDYRQTDPQGDGSRHGGLHAVCGRGRCRNPVRDPTADSTVTGQRRPSRAEGCGLGADLPFPRKLRTPGSRQALSDNQTRVPGIEYSVVPRGPRVSTSFAPSLGRNTDVQT